MHNHVIATLRLLKNHLQILVSEDDHAGTRVDRDELSLAAFEIGANRLHGEKVNVLNGWDRCLTYILQIPMLPHELVRSTRLRLGLSQRRLAIRAGTTEERLALAISWNRTASELANAGRSARRNGRTR